MLSLPALFALLLLVPFTAAVSVPFQRVRRPGLQRRNGVSKVSVLAASNDDNGLDLSTVHDLIYMANLTVGNTAYAVQLDTGSSDVWIKGTSSPLPNVTDTTTTFNLTYGIGWVFGHIAYGPVEFAGIHVPSQALLDVSSANNPALSYGAQGLVGLGFTSLSSIDSAINKTGQSTGRSLLYNLFNDNPSEPNYIAFSLQRSMDKNDETQGSFSIGEVEPQYASVLNAPAIPTWPISFPNRWNVLLEALHVGSNIVTPTTTVPNVPSNRAVVLLDSGTSYTYAPVEICDAIYSGVPGAQFSSSLGQWIVPCDAEVDIALQFGGQVFPIHPLDVTPASLSNSSVCAGSFVPQSVAVGAGEFDWLVGDNVLRSFYSIYDFGDFDSSQRMGDPYVKLLALVDPNEASKDFHAARGGTPNTNITYNASNNTSASSSTVTVSSDINDTLNKIVTFIPAMLGIMALNAVALIAIIVFGVVFLCRKRKPKATARKNRGRMTPMQVDPQHSYIAGVDQRPHAYEPISMAITDDLDRRPMSMGPRDSFAAGVPLADRTPVSMALSEDDMFIPPSPVARTFKSSGLRPKDRPSSANYQRQPSIAISDDQLLPPSPGFRNFDGNPGDRPRSVNYQRQPSEDSLVASARSFDERPRSVGYARSPSEDDSVFVASPVAEASEPVIDPVILSAPPPQRQAPPPSRQPPPPPPQPEAASSADLAASMPLPPSQAPSPQPQRRPSRESMASVRLTDDGPVPQPQQPSRNSVRLTDDQFASPGPIPRPRQPSRDSVRLVDDQFSPGTSSPQPIPRPRQPSNNSSLFVPREFTGRPGDRPQSFASTEYSALLPPSPAFHSDGGRPKSMAG